MTDRQRGRAEAIGKTMPQIIAVLESASPSQPFNAWELGHLEEMLNRLKYMIEPASLAR